MIPEKEPKSTFCFSVFMTGIQYVRFCCQQASSIDNCSAIFEPDKNSSLLSTAIISLLNCAIMSSSLKPMSLKDLFTGDCLLVLLLTPDERAVISLGSKVTCEIQLF